MASANTITRNIVDALANETAIERGGQVLRNISEQLNLAGVRISTDQITQALDEVSDVCPSVFTKEPPAVSTHYTSFGTEWRLRSNRTRSGQVRPCIQALYDVTDTMDRTMKTVQIPGREPFQIETLRPRAFAIGMGHLRVRWAQGNFTPPRASTIRRWVGI